MEIHPISQQLDVSSLQKQIHKWRYKYVSLRIQSRHTLKSLRIQSRRSLKSYKKKYQQLEDEYLELDEENKELCNSNYFLGQSNEQLEWEVKEQQKVIDQYEGPSNLNNTSIDDTLLSFMMDD